MRLLPLGLLAAPLWSCGEPDSPFARSPLPETIRYHVTDRLVSASLVLDGQGNVVARAAHHPYGERWIDTRSGDHLAPIYRFAGREDELGGGVSVVSRHYLPALGRFTAPDRLWLDEAPQEIERWLGQSNGYSWAANDPVDRVDVDGHLAPFLLAAAAGAIGGAIVEAAVQRARGEELDLVSIGVAAGLGAVSGSMGALARATGYTVGQALVVSGATRGLANMVRTGFEERDSPASAPAKVGHMARDATVSLIGFRVFGRSVSTFGRSVADSALQGATRSATREGMARLEPDSAPGTAAAGPAESGGVCSLEAGPEPEY